MAKAGAGAEQSIIIIKKKKARGHAAHGGAWKDAYADFVTAMMAFFLLMWLLGSTSKEERKVILIGLAQSNEHVSSLLRGLANDTPWLERPELVEIKATAMPQAGNPAVAALGKEARRVFEFSMTAMVKAPVVVDPSKPGARPAAKPVAQNGETPAPLAANSAGNSAGK